MESDRSPSLEQDHLHASKQSLAAEHSSPCPCRTKVPQVTGHCPVKSHPDKCRVPNLAKHFLDALEAAGELVGAILVQVPFPVTIALSFSIVVSSAPSVTSSLSAPSSVFVFPIDPFPMPACICSQT